MNDVLMRRVIRVVSKYYGVNPFIRSNKREFAECRYAIWYFLRFKIDAPYRVTDIARRFDRDHSTVCDGVTRLDNLLAYEETKQKEISEIEEIFVRNSRNIPHNLKSGKRNIIVKNDGTVRTFKQRVLTKAS